jgi:hypothetical protein
MKTFNRVDWEAALGEWEAGEFSDEWKPFRHQAAMRGMIYPPSGTRWDSWEDDEPSQRAILIRAIRETPALLRRCIDRSRSWSEVVAKVIAEIDELRDEAWRQTRQAERDRYDDPDPREATVAIKHLLERIGNS